MVGPPLNGPVLKDAGAYRSCRAGVVRQRRVLRPRLLLSPSALVNYAELTTVSTHTDQLHSFPIATRQKVFGWRVRRAIGSLRGRLGGARRWARRLLLGGVRSPGRLRRNRQRLLLHWAFAHFCRMKKGVGKYGEPPAASP